jgi:hypothetical protein
MKTPKQGSVHEIRQIETTPEYVVAARHKLVEILDANKIHDVKDAHTPFIADLAELAHETLERLHHTHRYVEQLERATHPMAGVSPSAVVTAVGGESFVAVGGGGGHSGSDSSAPEPDVVTGEAAREAFDKQAAEFDKPEGGE